MDRIRIPRAPDRPGGLRRLLLRDHAAHHAVAPGGSGKPLLTRRHATLAGTALRQGIEQAGEYRVGRAGGGTQLRLVEGAHKKWMVDPLNGPDFAPRVTACHAHSLVLRA